MDLNLRSGTEVVEDKVPQRDTEGDGETTERSETDAAAKSAGSDEACEQLPGGAEPACPPQADNDTALQVVEDGCTCPVCNFVAKTPTALKIHSARKHTGRGASHDKTKRNNKPEQEGEHASDVGTAETPQEAGLKEESDSEVKQTQALETGPVIDEVRSLANEGNIGNDGIDTTVSVKEERTTAKNQTDQEGETPTQQRRVSKRTPKPKIIYSCNYCGQEFRDKPLLDVHIKRLHTKDTEYICEYCSTPMHFKGKTQLHSHIVILWGYWHFLLHNC